MVLRRVTHADCAAIPAEASQFQSACDSSGMQPVAFLGHRLYQDLAAAVRWAKGSEEALAKSLKHIQDLTPHFMCSAYVPRC